MKSEHCHHHDSNIPFTTQHYNITTTARQEWAIVVEGAPCRVEHSRHGRTIHKIEELMNLDLTKKAGLKKYEVIALVLYTGPMVRCALGFVRIVRFGIFLELWDQFLFMQV